MGGETRTAEQIAGALAATSHGVVGRPRLLDAGLTARQIERRVESGALIRVHRGVYRVGHCAPSLRASYLAAVLAGGDGTLLGGRANAYLLGLGKGSAPRPEIVTPNERRIPGVITHRARADDRHDRWNFEDIPCTTVARTLVDLARYLGTDALARACHEATVRYRIKPEQVEAVLARRPSSPGATTLRRVLRGDVRVTLSVVEAEFLRLLGQIHRPPPQTNRPAGGRYVDCRWPAHRLTVELDSYRYHSSRHAWERDRRREREAYARGDDLRRYTYGDVMEDPEQMLAELCGLLPECLPA